MNKKCNQKPSIGLVLLVLLIGEVRHKTTHVFILCSIFVYYGKITIATPFLSTSEAQSNESSHINLQIDHQPDSSDPGQA